MSPTIVNFLFGAGVVVLVVYFPLFTRAIKTLSPEEHARFLQQPLALGALLYAMPMVAAFFVEGLALRAVLAVVSLALMAWDFQRQNTRLLAQGFDPAFVSRLGRTSVLGGAGVLLLLVSAVLEKW